MMHRKRGWAVAAVLLVVLQLLFADPRSAYCTAEPNRDGDPVFPAYSRAACRCTGMGKKVMPTLKPLLPAFGARKQQRSRQILTAQRKM